MTRWSMVLCSAVVWLSACGSPLGDAELKTDEAEYAPGSELTLSLHNESFEKLGYNLCGVSLQRSTEAGWETLPAERQEVCQSILLSLGPGEAESVSLTLAGTLPEGEYRFLTRVEWDGEREELASPPFRVVR
ncbi:immunoglobulin-like domain-containing protein [Hyalangium rubrum]|uniref:Immunoglobulin-like domain-containing protein n=1 Tax=Hyalangium rubrum TaxID=3103134 RepID=A0ABU5H1N9_9BACT|nr:immunoglobulin-like domain-containing protein [Hyalangium sp. s54d21]MDY7226829.1 immunoglobulin-like domain-containing protein [Hyalangium sp. s54d21]